MRILSLILAFAIAASTLGARETAATAVAAKGDEHACCKSRQPASHEKDDSQHNECGGACHMVCCRTVIAPADPIATLLDESPLAVRLVLPPLLADDLGEPQSIFHPPRA